VRVDQQPFDNSQLLLIYFGQGVRGVALSHCQLQTTNPYIAAELVSEQTGAGQLMHGPVSICTDSPVTMPQTSQTAHLLVAPLPWIATAHWPAVKKKQEIFYRR
jgi:hypothetical protein